jgi:SAM-dependent methyltransferase
MADAPWYETFFGRDYRAVYGYQLTPERTEREAAFLERTLALTPGEALLDLCCGPGRHALALAQRGLRVTGLDLSEVYLEELRRAAAEQHLEIETVRGDMRSIPFKGHFDAVINMFSSFGYLESEAEDAKVLAAIAQALKPGGRLLIDLINRDWVTDNYIQNDWHQGADGTIYLEHRELDFVTSRNHVTFTEIKPDGSRREIGGHHIRLYTLTELVGLQREAGLAFESVHGGFEGETYGVTARRMIVLARKPG